MIEWEVRLDNRSALVGRFAESQSQISILFSETFTLSVGSLEFSAQNLIAAHGSRPRERLDGG
jgi:hypothetical protein